jgi:sulfatase modifying factor 1
VSATTQTSRRKRSSYELENSKAALGSPCCAPARASNEPVRSHILIEPRQGHSAVQGMVEIPAGKFLMGSDSAEAFKSDGEGPVRDVFVDSFLISKTTVSNSEFAEFVADTGYETEAELFGWSFVFSGQLDREQLRVAAIGQSQDTPWWTAVSGASWKHPSGPGSSTDSIPDHPVVHVSWNDALSYANWMGMRLPTEAEWERAARGGLVQRNFSWGDELLLDGEHRCNVWQGEFPVRNDCDDGFFATAPNDSFEPNAFGLYNVSGNVWEWTSDWMSTDWHAQELPETRLNPIGPSSGESRVTKGGSFLCHESYCTRYRLSARSGLTPDSSLSHTGFRLAADPLATASSAEIRP